ncbi:MAG: hypothetical protein GY717_17095 [Rhodobacteraceae bacterium]|nr:hypothetical protein [Paracoccaceae bacterium]
MVSRTTLADALHQQGETQTAGDRFTEAEAMQAERQPQYPLLYSLQGFQYCDLLLAGAERAAWGGPEDRADLLRRCGEVAERAQTIFEWRKRPTWNHACDPDLDVALDQLTLARCALYTALLQDEPPETARADTDRALDGLRASGEQEFIAHGLLTRAWLRHHLGDPPGAGADLDEAQRIAERGSMRLHLADCHLTRARLFRDPSELARARGLIEEWGYGRRLGELEDTEAAAKDWPEPSGS